MLLPSPNHINWRTWKARPMTMVVLWPRQLYSTERTRVWAVTESTPITAIKVATSSAEKLITWRGEGQRYCASSFLTSSSLYYIAAL